MTVTNISGSNQTRCWYDILFNMLSIDPTMTCVYQNMEYLVSTDIIDIVTLAFHQLESTHRNWHAGVWFAIIWKSSEACQSGSCGIVRPLNSTGWHRSSKAIAVELIKLSWGEAWSFAYLNIKGSGMYIVVKPWLALLFKHSCRKLYDSGMVFRCTIKRILL
jgi:hypothetical protein